MEQRRGKSVCFFIEPNSCLFLNSVYHLYICRKNRAKKGKAGRPVGSNKGDANASPSKRQKVVAQESSSNISPGPVTRRLKQKTFASSF